MPYCYASQCPMRAQKPLYLSYRTHLCHVYHCPLFFFGIAVYPTATTPPQLVQRHQDPTARDPAQQQHPPLPLSLPTTLNSHPPLPPHDAQMLQHRFVGVQEPLHAVLYARLLLPVQAARRDAPRHALLPADVGQFVHGCRVGTKRIVSFFAGALVGSRAGILAEAWRVKVGGGGRGGGKEVERKRERELRVDVRGVRGRKGEKVR